MEIAGLAPDTGKSDVLASTLHGVHHPFRTGIGEQSDAD